MRVLPAGVQEIMQIMSEVYDTHNRLCPNGVIASAKLWVEIRDEVHRVFIDETMRKRFIRGVIEWGVFQKNYSFKKLYNRVFDYLSIFELDEHKERYVREFIVAYSEYAARRWGKQTYIGISNDVVTAAKVARRLVQDYKITMYEYVRRQHECWEKISQPLSMVAMMDEGRCRKRNEVYVDVDKKRGIIKKEDYKEGVVSRKWKEILNYGVAKYTEKANSNGYLGYVAKMYLDDQEGGLSSEMLKSRYSPQNVEENWKEVEGSMDL